MMNGAPIAQTELRKVSGEVRVPGIINGHILNVTGAAQFLGTTEKTLRAMVDRRVIPFRRLGRRIIFIREELTQFLTDLPGCTLAEAQDNREKRRFLMKGLWMDNT